MVDEKATVPSTADPPPATQPEAQEPPPQSGGSSVNGAATTETPAASEDVDLDSLLSKAGDKLWQHPTVAGRIGKIAQQQAAKERRQWESQRTEEDQRRATEDAERNLLDMARNDPVGFSERYLSDAERKRIEKEQSELRETTRGEFAQMVGKSFHSLAEWKDLSPDEFQKLTESIKDKDAEETIALFNQGALDLIAAKRAQKYLSEWRQKELPKEIEAYKKQWAAESMQEGGGPDLSRPRGAPKFDPASLSDEEFAKWWDKRYGKR